MMHGQEKSDRLTVPEKLSNKAERSAAEKAEGRSLAKGNLPQDDTNRMQGRRQVNSALRRIRQAAERDKKVRFTSLLHHIYAVDMLREAYFSLTRRAAPGVDGETWRHYGEGLEEHLQDLYLHIFDEKMAAAGFALTRFADDWVIICKTRRDAARALTSARAVLEGELGLRVHPDKTRIVSRS
jgi:hypothetical protein